MESMPTKIKEKVRESLYLVNYLLWLIFSPSKFVKIDKKRIKNVLIISFGAIGELLILTPLIKAIKEELNCKITFMISSENKNVFKHNPNVSEVIIYNKNLRENIEELKKRKFDLAIILPGSFKDSLMCYLAKIKYQIGLGKYNNSGGPSLFFNKNFYGLKKQHVVEDNLDVIRQIGIDNKNPRIEFYFSEKEEESAKEKLKKLKVKDYIIIHPGSGSLDKTKYPAKLWPLERFAETIDYLSKKYPYKILMTGSKNQKEIVNEILKKIKDNKKTINTCGLFEISELAYLVSKSKLITAPNTSIVHFASAFEAPIIELDGVGRPYQWHPWRKDKNYKVLFHNEVCTGCNGVECRRKTTECMKAITVEEVKKAIEELL